MLLSLHIENIAVIRRLDLDFSAGFCALTGETGAGKSIIIDSIGLLLGDKADRGLIRSGQTSAMVSGLFSALSRTALSCMEAAGVTPEEDGTILIQRSFDTEGKNRVYMGGRSVTLSVLRAVAGGLVCVHGQSDTRTLADPAAQLSALDTYAADAHIMQEYRDAYETWSEVRTRLHTVTEHAREGARMAELLRYQIADIDAAALVCGEEEALVERKVRLRSAERIAKHTDFAYRALRGSDKGSVCYLLERTARSLEQIADVIPEATEFAQRLRDSFYTVEDIAEQVGAWDCFTDTDPTEGLNQIESRLDIISKLKRKYGLTVDDILSFRARAAAELEEIENSDSLIEQLTRRERETYAAALEVAGRLHAARCEAVRALEDAVKNTLDFLDMPKVIFFASVKEIISGAQKVLTPKGMDNVEFFISANRGADPRPIGKIASGGELARIMLALKCALADKESIGTLIFDEIDSGVSGKTARKIGIKMKQLSDTAQVLCVTHSAQIASVADAHYLISKSEQEGVTQTAVRLLDREGRIAELSRILGGIEITEAQRRAAVDMLDDPGLCEPVS